MSFFTDLLGPSLVQKASSKVRRFDTLQTADVVKGNVVGLLFAAEWSEESTRFCERLAQTHREVTEAGGSFTLVLVSSDRDVDAFVRTLAGAQLRRLSWEGPHSTGSSRAPPMPSPAGPWCALPYTDKLKSRVDALSKRFKARFGAHSDAREPSAHTAACSLYSARPAPFQRSSFSAPTAT
jgi:hypothetical protein